MINRIIFFFFLLFVFGRNGYSMDFKNHPDYELILRTAELGDELLKSGKIYFTVEIIDVDSLSERTKIEFETKQQMLENGQHTVQQFYRRFENLLMFKNNKLHLIEKAILKFKEDVYFFKYEETVYDGETTSKLRLDSLAAGRTIEPYGDLYEGNIIDYSANPQWYGYFIGGMKISSFLNGDPFLFYRKNSKEKIKEVKFIKNETINGNKCIVVKETSKDTKNIMKAWNKRKGYWQCLAGAPACRSIDGAGKSGGRARPQRRGSAP